MHSRKLTLQLTPLLDLLLIVIFAQYMEVRENQAAIEEGSQQAIVQRDEAMRELESLAREISALHEELEEYGQRMSAAEEEQQRQTERQERIRQDLDRALAQHRVLGELVVELFQVPPDEVRKVLDPDNFPAGNFSDEELERLREKFRELSMERAGRMIEHLLSYDEIRKRADVWEVHLDEQGIVTLTNGPHHHRQRIPVDDRGNVDRDRFVAEFYAWYRSMPQPKSLVIILLTYERETRFHLTQPVREALPLLTARMQQDSGGRTRFEYADLGFRIE
jgi:hypothetical protein